MKTKPPRKRAPTFAYICRRLDRTDRLLKGLLSRLAFLEERAVLSDRADVRMRKSFRS